MATPHLKRRTIILTAATVAITAVGAYTGAQLKTDAETKAIINGRREEGLDSRIDRLRLYRDGLERRKIELEAKIASIHEKKNHRSP